MTPDLILLALLLGHVIKTAPLFVVFWAFVLWAIFSIATNLSEQDKERQAERNNPYYGDMK